MKQFGVLLLIFLSGCSSARTVCDKVEGRIKSAAEFCRSVAVDAAKAQCGAANKEEVEQCIDLVAQMAFSECVSRTGSDRLAWVLQEFCN
jgi:hypothetical protein